MIVVGLVLGLSAIKAFDRVDTPRNPNQPTRALAFDGPYRFTRNPMYTGMALILLGTGIATNSGWMLAVVPFFLGVLHFAVIQHEERYLERKFGAEYATYRKRVRRWL